MNRLKFGCRALIKPSLILSRPFSLTPVLSGAREQKFEVLQRLKLRRVPYIRKGTKAETKPPLYYPRSAYIKKCNQSIPNTLQVTSQDYKEGIYSVKPKTKGDDMIDYTSFNWNKNEPALLGRTVMVQQPDSPMSVARAFVQLELFMSKEGLSAYHGAPYRYKERPQDLRRRLAHNEAKRLIQHEITRKKHFIVFRHTHARNVPKYGLIRKKFMTKSKVHHLRTREDIGTDLWNFTKHAQHSRNIIINEPERRNEYYKKDFGKYSLDPYDKYTREWDYQKWERLQKEAETSRNEKNFGKRRGGTKKRKPKTKNDLFDDLFDDDLD